MADQQSDVQVTDDQAHERYLITVDGVDAGGAYYSIDSAHPERVRFTHTEIADEFGGRGLGSKLAKAALDDVRATGRTAIPQCPFIAGYIRKHQEYLDIVDERHRRSVTV